MVLVGTKILIMVLINDVNNKINNFLNHYPVIPFNKNLLKNHKMTDENKIVDSIQFIYSIQQLILGGVGCTMIIFGSIYLFKDWKNSYSHFLYLDMDLI